VDDLTCVICLLLILLPHHLPPLSSLWLTITTKDCLCGVSLPITVTTNPSPTCIPVANNARGVCVDLAGYVYVCCAGGYGLNGVQVVKVRDPRMNFSLLQTLGGEKSDDPSKPNQPTGLCVDDTNTLMVAEYGNNRVQFFN
jgi:hypothetical protein